MLISSVSDALAAMDYLLKRELLCDRCGIKLATMENANHSVCAACRPKYGEFTAKKIPNKLEEGLCAAIEEWLKEADAGRESEAGGELAVADSLSNGGSDPGAADKPG